MEYNTEFLPSLLAFRIKHPYYVKYILVKEDVLVLQQNGQELQN